MNILLTAATGAEIAPSTEYILTTGKQVSQHTFEQNGHFITLCISGVGLTATSYAVTKALFSQKFDFAIQVGIAGSFDRTIDLGDVVFVTSEQFGDMGAEDKEKYIDIINLGLLTPATLPFVDGKLLCPSAPLHKNMTLRKVTGISVNTVTGHAPTIKRLIQSYDCQVESMEGAAFHYCCLMEKIPFAQIRSISNYIEPRDKSKWKMDLAIQNLNNYLIQLIDSL